jgi:cysteine desulfurase/selenocysteine lyase
MPKITDRARELRNNPTDAEKLLWSRIQHEQLGVKFRRQHPIKPYYADFCCIEKRLVIEVDGGQHNESKRDERRDAFMQNLGYKVLRFWNNEVLGNTDGVLERIAHELTALPPNAPPPINGRGGKGGRANSAQASTYRSDFPIFKTTMNGKRLAFLDTAASAQKPQVVIDAMTQVMGCEYANIHRGLYSLSQNLTARYEAARETVARFIGAPSAQSIVFVRNTTEAINLIAQSWGGAFLNDGDEIILSAMEHHANIVPWQLLKENKKIEIKVIPISEDGRLDLAAFKNLLSARTRMVAVTHISNALGTINPVKEIIEIERQFNPEIKVLIDGSQAVVHGPVDVRDLDCDFYVFTGHKVYGPTGIGVLYGKCDVLESMPPYQGGGDMIERVSFEKTTFKEAPAKFEAGTPAITEVIGLAAAIDYMQSIGMGNIEKHEQGLLEYATAQMNQIPGLKIYGPKSNKAGIISFTMDCAAPSDIAMILDKQGVAIRAGHHCCMPLMQVLGVEGTARVSFGLYSDKDDVDQFVEGLKKVQEMFS